MKTINLQNILISTCLLFCMAELNAQKLLPTDLFVGNWFYQGPQNPKLNDTIWLMKTLPDDQLLDYTKWEFSESHIFDAGIFKALDNDKNKLVEIREAKHIEYRWFFNNNVNQLRIEKYQAELIFKIIDYQKQVIKLIRIN